jgi:acyl carrier protein
VQILKRLEPIFRDVLSSSLVLTEELNASNVPEWDSLNHISLVVAIEGEFGVELSAIDLAGLKDVGDMISMLESKGCIHE